MDEEVTTQEEDSQLFNAEDYPGINLAYDFVRPSYDWATNRLDAMDARLRGIQAFVSGFTLGAPVIAKAALPQLSYL